LGTGLTFTQKNFGRKITKAFRVFGVFPGQIAGSELRHSFDIRISSLSEQSVSSVVLPSSIRVD
jgi:hypothetical protein